MYKDKILKLLRSSSTGFVSGEKLAAKLGVSRTMVWKHIKSLEQEGFGIEAVPSRGYRITFEPDLLRIDDIRHGLKTKTIGRQIRLEREVGSTNTLAMEMATREASDGTVVLAELQTGGRGRLGRKWISPAGNLYLSVILRPDIPTHRAPLVTLMGAVAVASAVRAACGLPAVIKWPNDILLSGKKVSGLLTEMSAEPDRVKHIVLGIGLDVNMDLAELPADLRSVTTTLATEAGRRIDRTALLQQVLRELDHWYGAFLANDEDVLRAWESLNATTGRSVAVSGQGGMFEGMARGIDSEGRLLVEVEGNRVLTIASGDVTILKKLP